MLSKNRIQSLPTSLGQLRELTILLADVNALTRLPATLGQCESLRILNLATNNLLMVPDEIGKLKELRVLNLSNNYLRWLPASMADLPNLTALWLNDNQKNPLVNLQRELDEKSNKEVLTCVLLPQTGPAFGPVSPAVAAAVMAAAAAASGIGHPKATRGSQGSSEASDSGNLQASTNSDKKQNRTILHGVLDYGLLSGGEHGHLDGIGIAGSIASGTQRCLAEEDEVAGDLLQMSNTLDKSAYLKQPG